MHRITHPASPSINAGGRPGRRIARAARSGLLAAAVLALGTACTPESIDLTLNANVDDFRIGNDPSAGQQTPSRPGGDVVTDGGAIRDNSAGAARPVAGIADGSSNTIGVGQSGNVPADDPTSAPAPATPMRPGDGGGAAGADSGAAGGGGASAADAADPAAANPDAAETIRILTQEFGNRFFEFGRSSGSSDNDRFITGTNQLTLCANGRFFLREQISFSSPDLGFIPDPDDSIGNWVIVVLADNVPAVELRVEQTTSSTPQPTLQFELALDAAGNLFMGGARVFTIEDATANCR